MKIIDSIWNNIDIIQPKLGASVTILDNDGEEYITVVSEEDLRLHVVRCFYGPEGIIYSKLWKYHEDN